MLDVNEAPSTPSLSASSVSENAAGAIIGNITSTDPDAGDSVTFSVSDTRFEVVSNQLKLKAGVSLDYEAAHTVPLTITATDSHGLSSSRNVTITVVNVNEAPTAPTLSATTVAENLPGSIIGTVSATDPDAGDTLTYSVSDSRFQIVSGKLQLKTGISLDHEAEPTVNVTITATDNHGLATSKNYTITVTDKNEAPFAPSLDHTSIAENTPGGVIGTFATADPDAGDHVTYTLSDSRFEVVAGQLKLKSGISLNYETEHSVTVHVTATDTGGLSTSSDITVTVTDQNEAPAAPTLSASLVSENAPGAVIGTVAAIDPDAGDHLSFTVSDNRFEVVNSQLKLKDGVSLDHESEPQVTLTVTARTMAA